MQCMQYVSQYVALLDAEQEVKTVQMVKDVCCAAMDCVIFREMKISSISHLLQGTSPSLLTSFSSLLQILQCDRTSHHPMNEP